MIASPVSCLLLLSMVAPIALLVFMNMIFSNGGKNEELFALYFGYTALYEFNEKGQRHIARLDGEFRTFERGFFIFQNGP